MNTIELLNSINLTVKGIADSMKPQNVSGATATAKLSKGDTIKTSDVNPAADAIKVNISKGSITEIVGVLNSLSPSIKNLASISDKQINGFKKVIESVINVINNLAEISEEKKEAIKGVTSISILIDKLASSINKLPKFIILAPMASLGVKMSGMVISSLIDVLEKVDNITNVNDKVKKLNDVTKSIDSINNIVLKAVGLFSLCVGLGALVAMGPTKDIMLLGFATLGTILLTVTAIVGLTGLAAKIITDVKAIEAINTIMNVMFKATLLIGVCMGLGYIISNAATRDILINGLIVFGGVILAVTSIILLTGLAGVVIKAVGAFDALKNIMTLTLASIVLVSLCFGLGLAIEAMGGWEPLYKGLLAVGGTIVMLGTIFFLVGLAAKIALTVDTLRSMGFVLGLTFGAMAVVVASKYLGDMIIKDYDAVILGLVSVAGVMTVLVGIGALATKYLSSARQGLISLAVLEVLAVGATGVVALILELDRKKTEYNTTWGDLYLGLLAISGVITGFGILAGVFSKVAPQVLLGSLALASVEAMALGVISITDLLVELHNKKEKSGIGWFDIELDVLGISAVIGTFGILAGVFSTVAAPVLLGSMALASVGIMLTGVIGITHLLIDLHNKAAKSGIEFSTLETDVLWMSSIMGTFGVLAGAAALLPIPIAIGTPGIIAVSGFAVLIIGVISNLVRLSKAINDVGGAEKLAKTLNNDIPLILKNINADNFGVDMGIATMMGLTIKYGVMSQLVKGILTVVESISKIAKISGIVDDQGRISPVLSIDKDGNIKYGEPVDLKNVATIISGSIKTFVENCKYSFEDLMNVWVASEIFEILGSIVDPVAKFVDMLTGYKEAGEGMLAKVTIDEKGNVKIGQAVNIAEVSGLVSKAISTFVTELYKKENTEKWSEIIYGDRTFFEKVFFKTNKRADSVREVAGVLGIIMDPVVKFVDMVTSLEADGTNLSKIIIDKDGNIKSGTKVNVMKVAINVANAFTFFVDKIYSSIGKLDSVNKLDDIKIDAIVKPLQTIVKIANDLTGDTVNSEKINANTEAILNYINGTTGAITKLNPDTLNPIINSLNSIVTLSKGLSTIDGQKILVNSKNISAFMRNVVQSEYKKSTATVNKFSNSITILKKSLKSFDDVLIKDDNKRQKALDNFLKKVKEVLKEMKEAKESMDSFNSVIVNTSQYSSSPKNAAWDYKLGNRGNEEKINTPYAPGYQGETNNSNQSTSQLSKTDIESITTMFTNALSTALAGVINNTTITSKTECSGNDISALINALKFLNFDVQTISSQQQ